MVCKKQIISFFFIILVIIVCACVAISIFTSQSATEEANEITTTDNVVVSFIIEKPVPDIAPLPEPLLFGDIEYVQLFDISQAKEELLVVNSAINQLDRELARDDLPADTKEININELYRILDIKNKFEYDLGCLTTWENEHYYAAKVWEYFRQRGYSEVVTAGILGNMMVETAGGTLDLVPSIYDPSRGYYGLCQWSLEYHPQITKMSFEQQLDYLVMDMPGQFKTFGKCYRRNFTYEDFIVMESSKEAAIAFAKVYERCNSKYYHRRVAAAEKAYNYFTNNKI